MAKRYRVTLTVAEREALRGMISRGKADARVLLQADAQIARILFVQNDPRPQE